MRSFFYIYTNNAVILTHVRVVGRRRHWMLTSTDRNRHSSRTHRGISLAVLTSSRSLVTLQHTTNSLHDRNHSTITGAITAQCHNRSDSTTGYESENDLNIWRLIETKCSKVNQKKIKKLTQIINHIRSKFQKHVHNNIQPTQLMQNIS